MPKIFEIAEPNERFWHFKITGPIRELGERGMVCRIALYRLLLAFPLFVGSRYDTLLERQYGIAIYDNLLWIYAGAHWHRTYRLPWTRVCVQHHLLMPSGQLFHFNQTLPGVSWDDIFESRPVQLDCPHLRPWATVTIPLHYTNKFGDPLSTTVIVGGQCHHWRYFWCCWLPFFTQTHWSARCRSSDYFGHGIDTVHGGRHAWTIDWDAESGCSLQTAFADWLSTWDGW